MKYFLHDTNAFQDEKISELFLEHGYEGLGLFYTALEKIAAQEKPIKTSVLKAQLKVGKRLEKCWSFMEQIGIICSTNGETFNKQLLNYAETYQIKKEKNAKRISQWRDNQDDKKNVTHSENVRNASKVKVSKGIVSKGKKEREGEASSPRTPAASKIEFTQEQQTLFKNFELWIAEKAPTISKMRQPFTISQYVKLREKFTKEQICDLVLKMHNRTDTAKKNLSAYLTFLNWSGREFRTGKGQPAEQVNSQAEELKKLKQERQ